MAGNVIVIEIVIDTVCRDAVPVIFSLQSANLLFTCLSPLATISRS